MENRRIGDKQAQPYRTSRFYNVANEWFFSVRETSDQGPFINKLSAEEGLEIYISDCQHFNNNEEKKTFLSLV